MNHKSRQLLIEGGDCLQAKHRKRKGLTRSKRKRKVWKIMWIPIGKYHHDCKTRVYASYFRKADRDNALKKIRLSWYNNDSFCAAEDLYPDDYSLIESFSD